MQSLNALEAAIELAQQDKKAAARLKLLEAIEQDPTDVDVWLWLSYCAANKTEYSQALRQVLYLQPTHQRARRLVLRLARQAIHEATGRDVVAEKEQQTRMRFSRALVVAIVLAMGLFLAVGGLLFSRDSLTSLITRSSATTDTITVCANVLEDVQQTLGVRCQSLEDGQACYASPTVDGGFQDIDSRLPLSDMSQLRLDGYSDLGIGLVRWQSGAVQGLAVGQAVMQSLSTDFSSFTLQSVPSEIACETILPSGVLLQTQTISSVTINDVSLDWVGTLFLEADELLQIMILDGYGVVRWRGSVEQLNNQQQWQITLNVDALPQGRPGVIVQDEVSVERFTGWLQSLGLLSPWADVPQTELPNGSWLPIDSSVSSTLYDVDFANPDYGIAVGTNGSILVYDAGVWTRADLSAVRAQLGGQRPTFYGVNIVGDSGWIVGENGVILRLTDRRQWELMPSPTTVTLNAVNGDWIVGEDGVILQWDGDSWQSVDSPTENILHDVNLPYIVGEGGILLQYVSDQWQQQLFPDIANLWAIDGRYIASEVGIYRQEFGVWKLYPSDISLYDVDSQWFVGDNGFSFGIAASQLNDVSLYALDNGWAVGEGGSILYFENNEE